MRCPVCKTDLIGTLAKCPRCGFNFKSDNATSDMNDAIMATTGTSFDGYHIAKYIGIKSGEVVLGTGFISELSTIVSGSTAIKNSFTKKVTDAKAAALNELYNNCVSVGANAVIGVDINITLLSSNIIAICANGTAVVIEKEKE